VRPFRVGPLFQHLALRKQCTAQLLRRPGQEQLGLDQAPAEKRTDRLLQLRHVIAVDGAQHDALGVLRAQGLRACQLHQGSESASDDMGTEPNSFLTLGARQRHGK
jgi:hypothetical protein